MNVQTYAGVTFALVCASLAQLARTQLGKSFSVTPKAKELVTHGLYSRLRHPMYLFLDLTICGIAFAVHQWYVLLLLVILFHSRLETLAKSTVFFVRNSVNSSRHIVELRGSERLVGHTELSFAPWDCFRIDGDWLARLRQTGIASNLLTEQNRTI